MSWSVVGIAVAISLLFVGSVSAARFSSTSYAIDASVLGNSFGDSSSSSSYKLTSSGGESVIGDGAGGSYKLGIGYTAQLPRSLQLTLQPSGMVGYWPFEETGGRATYDQSAQAKRIDLAAQTFAAGKISGGLQLDGSTNAAVMTDSTPYDFQSSDFTISYWQLTNSTTGAYDVMGKWQDGVGGFAITQVNGAPLIFLNNINVYRYCSPVTPGAWMHIVFVKQGTTLNCYENGVLANASASGTPPANIGSTAQPFKIGVSRYGTSLTGSLDEVKLFSRALRVDEVEAEYLGVTAGTGSGVSLGSVVPGTSNTTLADAIVLTDAPSYLLAISQNNNLTSGAYTVPSVSGTIAAPTPWTEGTTKGLGFTLSATNATAIPGVWSGGNNYAAFPGAATTFYSRAGQQATPDYVTLKLRLDVPASQAVTATPYSNTVTLTGTITP